MIDRDPDGSKDGARLWESLDEEAAESVRKHLVALRGGAPFLSPDDAELLHRWLADGWSANQILVALERACDARRRRPRRTPLQLRHAKPHLGKSVRRTLPSTPVAPARSTHPLARLAEGLRARDPRLEPVADALLALPTDDIHTLEARAHTLVRDALLARWTELTDWEREARAQDARASLDGLGLPDAVVEASAEEIARDELRRQWPLLSAAAVQQALSG